MRLSGSPWSRVRAVFEGALDVAPDERPGYLERECAGDAALRAEVEVLLAAHEGGASFMTPPSGDEVGSWLAASVAPLEPVAPGTRIGGYVIRRLLASGGMGTVYEAEQEQPRRRVALKVMRWGLGSAAARERFRYEGEVLARLRHPNIAQIHAAGVHLEPGGFELPWFALELVPGAATLSEHVERQGCGLDQRLGLMLTICDAVQHGHQQGVIHRDLKPGNLLVGREGRPKVIDFGVARAAELDLAATHRTQAGELVGTLQYMSPEQIDGDVLAVDTRADVYALGVVLYELVAGRLPYDLTGLPLSAVTRTVRDVVPPPPSRVAADLPRELDWVVLKALAKDRDERYDSVAALAADLRRCLAHEPVLAGPPSARYRMAKFVRRHRLGVGAAALLLITLVGGVTGTSLGWLAAVDARHDAERQTDLAVEARQASEQAQAATAAALVETEHQRRLAEESARTSDTVVELMLDLFGSPDPALDGRDVRVVDSLARAEPLIAAALVDQPAVDAALRQTLGALYYKLGVPEEAEGYLRAAWERRRSLAGPDDGTALAMRGALGMALVSLGQLDEADEHLTAALDGQTALHGARSAEALTALNNLAFLRQHQGRRDEAAELYRETLAGQIDLLGEDDVRTQLARQNLGSLLMGSTPPQLDEADAVLTPALAGLRHVLHEDHPELLKAIGNLATLRLQQGRYEEAVPLLAESLERRGRILPPEHDDILIGRGNLAALYFMRGDIDAGLALYEEILTVRREHFGPRDAGTLKILCNLSASNHWKGDHAAEAAWLDELLALELGEQADNLGALQTVDKSIAALLEWDHGDLAEPLIRQLLAAQRRLAPEAERPALLWNSTGRLANALQQQGRLDEAEALFVQLEADLGSLPDGAARQPVLDREFGTLLTEQGRFDEAEARLEASWAVFGARYHPTERATAVGEFVALYEAWGRADQAELWRAQRAPTADG